MNKKYKITFKKLRNNFYIFYTNKIDYYISYETIVLIQDEYKWYRAENVDFYSSTTSKHIKQFTGIDSKMFKNLPVFKGKKLKINL